MGRGIDLLHAGAIALVVALTSTAAAAETCDTLLPPQQQPNAASGGALDEAVLARMRDAGPVDHYRADRPILALSPDGSLVAFEIHQGDPAQDSYCTGLVVLPLGRGGEGELVGGGHELILDPHPAKGWAAFESGVPLPITPRWSPNGRWIAFLKRAGGSTQVWRVDLSAKGSRQITHSDVDVDDFRIADDGRTLVYAARPDLAANAAQIDREGLRGWHVDARMLPVRGARPMTPDAPTIYRSLDIAAGDERAAMPDEAALFGSPARVPKSATAYAQSRSGTLAWIEPAQGSTDPSNFAIVTLTRSGHRAVCPAEVCQPGRFTRLWWSDDGRHLRFTRREGWAGSEIAIYDWEPGTGTPSRIYRTRDHLVDCQPVGDDLLCFRERSTEPRHLVLLGLGGGTEKTIFQTNPEFASLTKGRVERREWTSALGAPFFADLVYPVGYEAGRAYPMVVVQYRTHGFLRGGTGDEMPVQAFANRGYFVLVFDIGNIEAIIDPQSSEAEKQVALVRDHFELRHILSGLETITHSLIDAGMVDRERIGIHGLSAGAGTVQFAAINSNLFSAGSMGGCCWGADQDAYLGPTIAEAYHALGWPKLIDPAATFWSGLSLTQDPKRVRFPILLQAADREFAVSLSALTALSQADVPVDGFVFPDEYHLKWHPAHRLAIYERNLAWFDFWLKDEIPQSLPERDEAMRWRAMREKWLAKSAHPRTAPN